MEIPVASAWLESPVLLGRRAVLSRRLLIALLHAAVDVAPGAGETSSVPPAPDGHLSDWDPVRASRRWVDLDRREGDELTDAVKGRVSAVIDLAVEQGLVQEDARRVG